MRNSKWVLITLCFLLVVSNSLAALANTGESTPKASLLYETPALENAANESEMDEIPFLPYAETVQERGYIFEEQTVEAIGQTFLTSSLSQNEQILYDRLFNAMDNVITTRIDLSDIGFSFETIGMVFYMVVNDNSFNYFVDGFEGTDYIIESGYVIETGIKILYRYDDRDTVLALKQERELQNQKQERIQERINEYKKKLKQEYEKEIERMIETAAPASMREQMSQTELALALHDILVLHTKYDNEWFTKVDVGEGEFVIYRNVYEKYGPIVEKRGACNGYTLAYNDMLKRVGINTRFVGSNVMDHAWSLVEITDLPGAIDPVWFHVDVTWDDPLFNSSPDGDRDMSGYVGHDFFMCSDSEIAAPFYGERHYGFETSTLPKATMSHPNSAFWDSIRSAMLYYNGYWYYNPVTTSNNFKSVSGSIWKSPFGLTQNGTKLISPTSFIYRDANKIYYYKANSTIERNGAIYCYNLQDETETVLLDLAQGYFVSEMNVLNKYMTYVKEAIYDSTDTEILTLSLVDPNDVVHGDVDGDGLVTLADSLVVSNYTAGRIQLTSEELLAADVNGDGQVMLDDSLLICNYVAGRFAQFPVE